MDPSRQLVIDLIVERLEETRLTMAQVSRQLNRNPAYLQQFIARKTPWELEEQDRFALAKILNVEPDKLKGPSRPRKYSRTLTLRPPKEVRSNNLDLSAGGSMVMSELARWLSSLERMPPVYSSNRLENGSFKIASYPRSRTLLSEHSYCLQIFVDTLPELRSGSIAFVDPGVVPHAEMICVLRRLPVDNGGEACVRRIFEITEENFRAYVEETSRTSSKRSVKHSRKPHEDFSKKEWRADVVVGSLFPSVT